MRFSGYLKLLLWPGILVICLMGDYRAINGLKHFVLDEGWEIGIEFDYPEAWEWKWEYWRYAAIIKAYDPAYPPIRRNPLIKGPVFQRHGSISLLVRFNSSPETMIERIDSYLVATEAIGAEILEDKTVDIDGVSARWLTRWGPEDPALSQDFELYDNAIYFYAQGNVYVIHLGAPYDNRDSDFVKGFEDMIASIRFVP